MRIVLDKEPVRVQGNDASDTMNGKCGFRFAMSF